MKEESTKFKDKIRITRKTSYIPLEIPKKEIPSSKTFDVRIYRGKDWVMFFLDKKLYDKLKERCDKKGLDVKEVIFGSIVKSTDLLK